MSDMKYIKELLSTGTGTEGSILIPRKIYSTLILEVEKALIPRSEAALYFGPGQIPGSSIDINLSTPNKQRVRVISEGAEIALDQAEYTGVNIKPVKYGVAVRITRELLEDAQWNLLEHNIKLAGVRLAENETSLILAALQGCTSAVTGGAAITIANITRAIQYLDDNDYHATSLFVGMEVLNDLRNIDTFVEYQKVGNTEMITKGFQGVLYGLQVMKFSTNAAPTTTYSKYAYVVDKNQAYGIAEKRVIAVENFDLPTFDMSAAAITQRIAVSLLRDLAACRISTT